MKLSALARTAIIMTAALFPLAAHGQSAADPVNRIMDVAKARWESVEGSSTDYFEKLDRDFSKNFVAVYREASKYPAYDEGDSPFDYDVITSSQDGCPLKDITVSPASEKDGVSVVDVSFKLWTCNTDAESLASVNQLKFDVVMEDGKPVISDIHRFQEGKWDTLIGEMKGNIDYGKKNAQQ